MAPPGAERRLEEDFSSNSSALDQHQAHEHVVVNPYWHDTYSTLPMVTIILFLIAICVLGAKYRLRKKRLLRLGMREGAVTLTADGSNPLGAMGGGMLDEDRTDLQVVSRALFTCTPVFLIRFLLMAPTMVQLLVLLWSMGYLSFLLGDLTISTCDSDNGCHKLHAETQDQFTVRSTIQSSPRIDPIDPLGL